MKRTNHLKVLIMSTVIVLSVLLSGCSTSSQHRSSYSHKTQSRHSQVIQTSNSGDTVYVTKSGQSYHRADCPSLHHSSFETTRGQAEAEGKKPCKRCNP